MPGRSSTSIKLSIAMLQGPRDGCRGPTAKTSSAVVPLVEGKTVGCFFWLNHFEHTTHQDQTSILKSSKQRKSSRIDFMGYTAELATSPNPSDQKEAHELFLDWNRARSRMWSELVSKMVHYQQLPYKLLQLAHLDHLKAVAGAQICLALWERGGFGCKHRQSRRFLDPTWSGSSQDPSLRPLVIRLAQGEQLTDSSDFQPMIHWLSRFSCIRLAERSVESIHSLVTKMIKRAPHAAPPYISVELRFKSFWTTIVRDPPVPCGLRRFFLVSGHGLV